jgi:hypothetical protein
MKTPTFAALNITKSIHLIVISINMGVLIRECRNNMGVLIRE